MSRSIFDVYSTCNVSFNSCWDVELVVTSEGEFSCVNNLSIFCITQWLREASFKGCSHHTIFNLDVEFVCYIVTSCWVICFNCWSIYINFRFIEVISDSYRLNVFFVSCWEFSCIQPYLIVEFISAVNSLRIQVLSFVVWCIVSVWVRFSICVLVCQLFIIINELVASDIEFRFRNNVFLWLELRCCWRSYGIVELFVSWFSYVSNQCFSCTVMRYCYSYFCLHCIVSDSSVCTFNLCYSVLISTFLTLLVFKSSDSFTSFVCVIHWSKLDLTILIVSCSRNHNVVAVFQLECKFASFKLTTFQTFREVEFYFNWNWVYTFLSWFFWSFYRFAYWVVNMNDLVGFVFDVYPTRNIRFNCSWDIKFVVTTKCKFSCVDNLSIISIT